MSWNSIFCSIRKENGEIWCQHMLDSVCEFCNATGEQAHHPLICPKKKEEEKLEKLEKVDKSRESSSVKSAEPPQELHDEQPEAAPQQHLKQRHNSEGRGRGGYHNGYHHNNGYNQQQRGYYKGGRGQRGGGGYRGNRGGANYEVRFLGSWKKWKSSNFIEFLIF